MDKASQLKACIEDGNVAGLETLLQNDPGYANHKISWFLNQENISDPLHYISGCVFNGQLTNGTEGEMARLLLGHGAHIEGSDGSETPLIGSASLSAEKVSKVLLGAGASVEPVSVFGANALHWAAWTGTPGTVALLLEAGAGIEARCADFGATPLFWATQAFSKYGTKIKAQQVEAAKILLQAGADVQTRNKEGASALERSRESTSLAMTALLQEYGAR